MLNKFWLPIVIATLSISPAWSQEDLLKAMFDSQEQPKQKDVPGPESPKTVGKTQSMEKAASCEAKDQNSLPLRLVLGLLRDKGAGLTPSHNSDTGELTIYGGRMIGNCNSMLDYVISDPGDGLPYVFQVKVKGCGADECSYHVKTAENGMPKDLDQPIKVAPNMEGFKKCLELTGVFKDGQIVKEKIAHEEFKATKTGINETAQLWFASHGPFADPKGGVYSKGGNKKTGHGCFYFEDIQKDGFQVVSREDVEFNRARDEFQQLCKTQNYKLIDRKISDFNEFKSLQSVLVQIRNNLLEEEYKKVGDKLKKSKNFSEIDTSWVNETVDDFQKYILAPKKRDIMEQYRVAANATGKDRAAAQKVLNIMVDDFKKYAVSPYPNKNDLVRMQSFEKKAPIDDENWAQAVLSLNKTLNTVAVYQEYRDGGGESPIHADERILEAQGKFAREYAILRQLSSDKDYYRSKELGIKSNNLGRATQTEYQSLQRDIQEEMQYVQQHCYGKYYIANNPISLRNCVAEAQENIEMWKEDFQYYAQRNQRLAGELGREAEGWRKIEVSRDKAYGSKGNSGGKRRNGEYDSEQGMYHFNFQNNTTRTAQGPQDYSYPNFSYPSLHWGQAQPDYGMNRNFYHGNYNMGFQNTQFGMPSRGPANGPANWQYGGWNSSPWNQQGGMAPPYGNFQGYGGYNFNI